MTTQDTQDQEYIGARLEPVKVTRQEELQFGTTFAPMMRRLGSGATQIEQAAYQAERFAGASHDADGLMGNEGRRALDEHGRSPHTVWADSVAERLSTLREQTNALLADLGIECIRRENEWRGLEPSRIAESFPQA